MSRRQECPMNGCENMALVETIERHGMCGYCHRHGPKELPSGVESVWDMHRREKALKMQIGDMKASLSRLRQAVCIYAREELGNMNFESDDEVIEYFEKYLEDA